MISNIREKQLKHVSHSQNLFCVKSLAYKKHLTSLCSLCLFLSHRNANDENKKTEIPFVKLKGTYSVHCTQNIIL